MKLILAIVSNDDASAVSSALTKNNFYMTEEQRLFLPQPAMISAAMLHSRSKYRSAVLPSSYWM